MPFKRKYKILLVDDEASIIDFLKYNIEKEGYSVFVATNGQEAIEMTKTHLPDLILLDLMMPIMDGIEACQGIRELALTRQPLIAFLTSRSEDYSQVAGFEAGADDYISKPIRPRLLLSKIESLLRRLNYDSDENKLELDSKSIQIDREKFVVFRNSVEIILPKKEFELLEFLISRPGKVFNRDEILNRVWGSQTIVGERTIDVHIRKLREKLGDDYIRTIKGIGYTFVDSEK